MRRTRGFTMIEMIVVMILIGIIGAVAMPRLMGSNWVAPLALRDGIVTAMRYAQKSAVAKRRVVCATQTSAWLAPTFAIARAPGDGSCTVALPSTLNAGVLGNTALNSYTEDLPSALFFQPDGSITSDFAGQTPQNGTIRFSHEGINYTIRIEGAAGHVE